MWWWPAVVGGAVLVRHLVRRPPRRRCQVAALTGWVMLIAILLAPATRVGYLLYPINLFVWAWMLSRADDPADTGAGAIRATTASAGRPEPGIDQLSSGSSIQLEGERGDPAEVVGDTTAPTSQ